MTDEVKSTIRVRLYPNQQQEQQLLQFCGAARWVYNWGLQRWRQRYEDGQNTTAFDLANELVFIKKMDVTSWLKESPSQGLQQTLLNLGRAFAGFFVNTAKYPRFKKRGHRDSFHFHQHVEVDAAKRQLKLPKLGYVVYRGDIPDNTVIKTTSVVREGDGWYACIRTTKMVKQHSKSTLKAGLDAGVVHLFTSVDNLGTAQHWDHNVPRLNALVKAVDRCHEALSRKQRVDKVNSKNREKALARLRKAYAKLRNFRTNALHQLSQRLVRRYGTIVVEDLKITNMTKRAVGTIEQPNLRSAAKRGLNRVIIKQAWGAFFRMLEYKCAWYGRTFIKVDPKNTSRSCPQCNHTHKDNRKSQAVFQCVACGYKNNADIVGAINILRRGLLPAI